MHHRPATVSTLLVSAALVALTASAQTPAGEVNGTAVVHTAASARAVIEGGALVLPSSATAGATFAGPWRDAPQRVAARVPMVVFLHGSSGLGLAAIGEWQRWLATLGIASFAPDSFALPDRITYTSPIGKDLYEKIHALRASEIALALRAVRDAPWADPDRIVLAGTSEGAVAVARWRGDGLAGRLIYSWSCENNYFVVRHDTWVRPNEPVLNVISASDPFFSASNAWLGNPQAEGHCAQALKDDRRAAVILVPKAPHTLLNLPATRAVTAGFLSEVFRP